MSEPTTIAAKTRRAAVQPVEASPTQAPRQVAPIDPRMLTLQENVLQFHFCTVDEVATLRAMDMNPDACSLIADKLELFDNVRAVSKGGEAFADFVCVDRGPSFAVLKLVQYVERPQHRVELEALIPAGFTVREISLADPQGVGGDGRYVVVRDRDNAVISYGHPLFNRADAVAFMRNHPAIPAEAALRRQLQSGGV